MNKAKKIESIALKERINKFISSYTDEMFEGSIQCKKIFSTTEYIEWLISFTESQKSKSFTDINFLYNSENSPELYREIVDKLCLFYSGISKYAKENYIYPNECELGNYYKIRYKDIGLEIAVKIGQGMSFTCSIVNIDNEKDFIDFEDIMNNKKQDNVGIIDVNLNEIVNAIYGAYNNGVPIEAISDIINSTISEIKISREESSQYQKQFKKR